MQPRMISFMILAVALALTASCSRSTNPDAAPPATDYSGQASCADPASDQAVVLDGRVTKGSLADATDITAARLESDGSQLIATIELDAEPYTGQLPTTMYYSWRVKLSDDSSPSFNIGGTLTFAGHSGTARIPVGESADSEAHDFTPRIDGNEVSMTIPLEWLPSDMKPPFRWFVETGFPLGQTLVAVDFCPEPQAGLIESSGSVEFATGSMATFPTSAFLPSLSETPTPEISLPQANVSPRPESFILSEDGIGVAEFGDDASLVIERVTELLGTADNADDYDCVGTRRLVRRLVSWGGLTLVFTKDTEKFDSYTLSTYGANNTTRRLSTALGIRLGASKADLKKAYGDRVVFDSGDEGSLPGYEIKDANQNVYFGGEFEDDAVTSISATHDFCLPR